MEDQDRQYLHLGDELYHVLIPESYPLNLKLMVLAALKTYRLGNRSMDRVMKQYSDSWAEQFDVECSCCGRSLKLSVKFDPFTDDFISQCAGCGLFFCKNCLEWKAEVKPGSQCTWDSMPGRCRRCYVDMRRKKLDARRRKRPKVAGKAYVIDLASRRKT